MNYEKTAKIFRKKMLVEDGSVCEMNYNQEYIKKIISHRDPFLLIDSISSVDLKNKIIIGRRTINNGDPIFKGHFPEYAIYPGVLHIEMIGQLGLCLNYFLSNQSTQINQEFLRPEIRLIKVLHTLFQHEVLPGDNLTIVAKELESDDYTAKGVGQIVKDGRVCTVSIAEFYKV